MIGKVKVDLNKRTIKSTEILYNKLTPTRWMKNVSGAIAYMSLNNPISVEVKENYLAVKGTIPPGETTPLEYPIFRSHVQAANIAKTGITEFEVGKGTTPEEVKNTLNTITDNGLIAFDRKMGRMNVAFENKVNDWAAAYEFGLPSTKGILLKGAGYTALFCGTSALTIGTINGIFGVAMGIGTALGLGLGLGMATTLTIFGVYATKKLYYKLRFDGDYLSLLHFNGRKETSTSYNKLVSAAIRLKDNYSLRHIAKSDISPKLFVKIVLSKVMSPKEKIIDQKEQGHDEEIDDGPDWSGGGPHAYHDEYRMDSPEKSHYGRESEGNVERAKGLLLTQDKYFQLAVMGILLKKDPQFAKKIIEALKDTVVDE